MIASRTLIIFITNSILISHWPTATGTFRTQWSYIIWVWMTIGSTPYPRYNGRLSPTRICHHICRHCQVDIVENITINPMPHPQEKPTSIPQIPLCRVIQSMMTDSLITFLTTIILYFSWWGSATFSTRKWRTGTWGWDTTLSSTIISFYGSQSSSPL